MSEESASVQSARPPAPPGAEAELRRLWEARLLPRAVAWFYLQAVSIARRHNDTTTLDSAPPPRDLAKLLDLAEGHEHVVELGTGAAWTAIALALADERRRVTTFDQRIPAHRVRYLDVVRSSVRDRIEFRPEPAERAPEVLRDQPDFVSINGSGEADQATASYASAEKIVRPGGLVVLIPNGEPDGDGGELGREVFSNGARDGGVFVWRKPETQEPRARPRARLKRAGRVGAIVLGGLAIGGGVGALITLTGSGDKVPATTVAKTPAQRGRTPTVAPAKRAGPKGSRRPSSNAAPRVGRGGRLTRRFSGRGPRRLGTLNVDVPTALSWRTQGKRLAVSTRGTPLNLPGKEGSALLSPGSYPEVTIRSTGKWTVSLQPR